MTSAAADKLLSYPWPGNVRELQNCIERAVALCQFDHVGIDDLPDKIRDYKVARIDVESNDPADLLPMEEVERRYIARVLSAVGGNKTLAAQVLGFDRRTLYRKLDRVRDAERDAVSPVSAPRSGSRSDSREVRAADGFSDRSPSSDRIRAVTDDDLMRKLGTPR
jgi:DNA-binding NtrC family response regulator